MAHGLVVRKMQAGDVGLCTGNSNLALFRAGSISEMVEVLRQLHVQAIELENRSQWERETCGMSPGGS